MIRDLARELGGIGVYGITSMVLFFVFFIGALVWALALRKPYVTHMSQIPLQPDNETMNGDRKHD